jgi:hypothetical protein
MAARSKFSRLRATRSIVEQPMDPVEPRTVTLRLLAAELLLLAAE